MSITLPDLVLHLSKENQQTSLDTWKIGLPADLFKHILKNYLSFSDIISTADVCQDWRSRARDNTVGTRLLERAGLQPTEPATWMRTYAVWLNSHYYIVFDKSGSMTNTSAWQQEPWRMEVAMQKISEIARYLDPVMKHKGIKVTLFATWHKSKTVRNIEELVSFIKKRDDDLGPTRSVLSRALNEVEKMHLDLSAKTGLLSTAFIISDMGLPLTFEQLYSKTQSGLNFRLIKIGNDNKGSQLFETLESKYQESLQIQRQQEENSKKSRRSERLKSKTKSKSTPKRERMSDTKMLTFESIKEKKAKTE